MFSTPAVCYTAVLISSIIFIIILRESAFSYVRTRCCTSITSFRSNCILYRRYPNWVVLCFYPFVHFFTPISGTMTYRNLISNNSLANYAPVSKPRRPCRRDLEIAEIKERLRCRLWHHPRDSVHPNIKLLLYKYIYILLYSL